MSRDRDNGWPLVIAFVFLAVACLGLILMQLNGIVALGGF